MAIAKAPTSLLVDACGEPSRGSGPETDADTSWGLFQGRLASVNRILVEHRIEHRARTFAIASPAGVVVWTAQSKAATRTREAELAQRTFAVDAGTKAGTELSDGQRPSETFNPHESTEPDLSG